MESQKTQLTQFLWPAIWTFLGGSVFAYMLATNETTREVTFDSLKMLFSLLSTPFIMEFSCILIFLCCLMTYNQWRLNKDGDDWVYMTFQEPEPGDVSNPTQRLHSMISKEKPETLNQAEADAGVIEGYLELGMPTEAFTELKTEKNLPDNADTALLCAKVLAANLDTTAALELFRRNRERFPEEHSKFIRTAEENVSWLEKHLPAQTDAIQTWKTEATKTA